MAESGAAPAPSAGLALWAPEASLRVIPGRERRARQPLEQGLARELRSRRPRLAEGLRGGPRGMVARPPGGGAGRAGPGRCLPPQPRRDGRARQGRAGRGCSSGEVPAPRRVRAGSCGLSFRCLFPLFAFFFFTLL